MPFARATASCRPTSWPGRWAAAIGYDADKGHLAVAADGDGLTSEPSIYVAGDAGGMVGARAAQEQGFLAGVAAARALGYDPPPDVSREASRRRRRLARHRRFQAALWALFAAPRLHGRAGPRRHVAVPLRRRHAQAPAGGHGCRHRVHRIPETPDPAQAWGAVRDGTADPSSPP